MFFNETDLLQLRLEELGDIVDYFVIIESEKTFTSKLKTLCFNENLHLFRKYLHKIIHRVVDHLGDENPWANEFHQRNHISKVLHDVGSKEHDILILGDADEIPHPDSVKSAKSLLAENDLIVLVQDMYYYNFETYVSKWLEGSRICRHRLLKEFNCNQIRNELKQLRLANKKIHFDERGGWHFSYFGDEETIIKKIRSFSHQELLGRATPESIRKGMELGQDIYNRSPKEICFECKSSSFLKIPVKENKNLPSKFSKIYKRL